MTMVRAAVVQDGPVLFDPDATLDKVERWCVQARDAAAEFVLFPEAYVAAYPKGLTFGAVVGRRTDAGRAQFGRYAASAITVPGPHVDRLAKISAKYGLQLVVGVIEREGGTLYCTVLFFSPQHGYLGKHRKLMPTASERLIWGFGDGSTMPVFETPCGRVGAVICWENYMPLLRTAMYAQGIQLYCAPTADDRESWLPSMRHIAMEGRCFVLSCCQVLRRSDFPASDLPDEEAFPGDVISRGGSCLVGPLGEVLAGPLWDEPGLLVAELDLELLAGAKMDFDATGHYARPDVFQLHVNTQPQRPVSFGDGQAADG